MNHEIQLLYLQFTDLWKSLGSAHNDLYQVTCEEYLALLKSDIESVNALIKLKEELMLHIESLDKERIDLIGKVATIAGVAPESIHKFKSVYQFIDTHLNLSADNPLIKYHKLIIELVEKTQDQNKKNRLFLNKALASIQELKKDLSGNIKVGNYSRTGEKQDHCR